MKTPRHSMSVGEWLRAAKENIGAILFLLSLVSAGGGIVATAAAWWMDRRAAAYTEPIREIIVWKLKKDGELEEFLRDKAKTDSLDHATGRISAAGYPLFRSE